jgi:hypothetical protein
MMRILARLDVRKGLRRLIKLGLPVGERGRIPQNRGDPVMPETGFCPSRILRQLLNFVRTSMPDELLTSGLALRGIDTSSLWLASHANPRSVRPDPGSPESVAVENVWYASPSELANRRRARPIGHAGGSVR